MAKCAVCGTQHATCRPRTTVVPVDSAVAERKEGAMSDLKRYEVELPSRGGPRRTVLMLTDADAKRQGLEGKELKPAGKSAPSNKATTASGTKGRGRGRAAAKPKESATQPAAPEAPPAAPAAETSTSTNE